MSSISSRLRFLLTGRLTLWHAAIQCPDEFHECGSCNDALHHGDVVFLTEQHAVREAEQLLEQLYPDGELHLECTQGRWHVFVPGEKVSVDVYSEEVS